jgi:hypothetical protein
MLLQREEHKRSWFWARTEGDDLDELEDEVTKARWGKTATRAKRKGLTLRVIWFLIASIRRAMLDVSLGMMVVIVGAVILGGGWKRARMTLSRVIDRTKRFIT